MGKKISIIILYIGIGILIYFYGELLLDWLKVYARDYLVLTAIVATLLSLFPIIPYPVIGGIIGAAFGPLLGAFVVWIGSSLASIIMFLFVRYGYHDWGTKILRSYQPLEKVTVLFEKNAFITIFITRLIPFIPSIIVNCYSALSKVSFAIYAIASSLGKIPSMILFAVVGNTILTNPSNLLLVLLIYSLFLVVVYIGYYFWKRLYQTTSIS